MIPRSSLVLQNTYTSGGCTAGLGPRRTLELQLPCHPRRVLEEETDPHPPRLTSGACVRAGRRVGRSVRVER